ncbi:related to Tip elongation aberrant protein 1 [Ustilago trichophora]|uniref:Related to Tip elongation aberrant protein 1 n=1 Tax=Ustilago trichophora TaxID=86804 RepID=A0A5C3EBC1_9BASI|nr:related to Tip elongation aberrant protein 1 [Ustilago trichophora]
MPAPPIPPLSAMRSAQAEGDPTSSVQVLGMNVAQSQPLVRNPSGASDVSITSANSTPHHQHGDYAVTRTYIPSHGYTASRLQNQSSFSTGTSQSPASSEAHGELASIPSRPATHYEASTLRLANAPPEASSRRSQLAHANRVLSHKDSFGGSYAINAGADLSSESADEASISHYDDASLHSHHRTISLSRPAQQSHNGYNSSRPILHSQDADGSEVSDMTEPIEVLGRPSAFTDLAAPHNQSGRYSTLTQSQSRTALSAAANAASASTDIDPAIDPSDTTFATKFDRSLALNPNHDRLNSVMGTSSVDPSQAAASTDADLSSSERDTLDLPAPNTAKSSPGSSSTPLASKASDGGLGDTATPSASSRDLRSEIDSKASAQRKPIAPAPPQVPQPKDRRERSERDKPSSSTSRRPESSRAREAAAPSTSTRADAPTSTTRSLKTSHRTLPQLPSAHSVRPAPPPAMYWSKAPVHGSVPRRSFRAHTANLCDEVLWLFGGCDNRGCFRDLWCFDTETMCWSKPKVTGDIPPARRAHSATMVNKRLFVFAGGDGPHYFNDLYIFDTVSLRWSKPEVGGTAPSPRRAHTCNYYEGQLIVFGGGNGVGALNDVHTLDVNDLSRLEWRKMECGGKVPIGRGYHTCNLVDGKLIVIGGSDGHMSFNDIHILRLDTQTWYQVKTDEIHNRLGHTATQVGSYLFIFGGHDSKTYTSELLTLNLVNLQWEPRKVCGKKPQGRGYHQAWLRDSRLFVHGGFDGKDIFDDLHFLDLAACAYLPQITSFSVELDDEE